MIRLIVSIAFCVAPLWVAAGPIDSYARLRELFADPPAAYSTAPFLVWNGEVTEGEIDRHLADLHGQGIRAVFIHPRPGLITPYLSDRWFSLVRYTVERAKKLGIEVWLYDENSYPSGFAGGHVPAEMPESYNQGQGLVLRRLAESKPERCAVIVGDYCFELAYYEKRAWHGGFSYVDLIKPGVTEKFIELTMRGYERSIGAEFGKAVPGIFTDEPNINPPVRKNCIRWTPDLFPQFQKRWGYDLKPHLVSLFEETGDWRRVRHNYYALLLELFIERWAKPWHRYTEAKKLAWTGHYWEHTWPNPAQGPDNMAMYAWHHVPGIDMLFNQFREEVNAQFGNVRAVKELSSVANQMGRRRTLSETYGGAGWELRFEDMKRLGDWQYALGVNLMNQHLSHQTLMGARKYDYPQSFSYHTPWWKHYRALADYFARLSLALASGEQVNHILVLEPTSSAWMYASGSQAHPRMMEIGRTFQDFVTTLEKLQGEYDLGCENIIKDHGKVEGNRFVVGRRAYDLVVLPPGLENLDAPTAELLARYLQAGGTVLSFVEPPRRIDGRASDRLERLAAQHPSRWTRAGSLDELAARRLLLSGEFEQFSGSLLHHRRRLADGQLLFLSNYSLQEAARGVVRIQGRAASRLDAFTGRISGYPARREGGRLVLSFDLPPAGSLLLYIGDSGPAALAEPKREGSPVQAEAPAAIDRLAPNVIRIDYCDLRLGGEQHREVYFFQAAEEVFRRHGLDGNPWHAAVQYKTSTLDQNKFPPDSGFEADFYFEVEGPVDRRSMQAVVERPQLWKVSVNGSAVANRPNAWWLDRAFGVYDIGAHVREGRNVITLAARPMSVHHELEPVFVLGDFAVVPQSKGWKLTPPRPLALGAWKEQGLPFYFDTVSYAKTYRLPAGGSYKVRLGRWHGTVAEVKVNGKPAGIIGWQPYELDVSRAVRQGENRIEVVVYGSLKNLLGPHHGKINRGLASPASFRSAPPQMPPGSQYDLDAYGLMEEFTLEKGSGPSPARSPAR